MTTDTAAPAAPRRPPLSALQITLLLLASVVAVVLLYVLGRVTLILILAMFFAYLIAPPVQFIEHWLRAAKMPRGIARSVAIGVVYVALAGSVTLGADLLLPPLTQQVAEVAARGPAYAQSIRQWGVRWSAYERSKFPVEVRQRIDQSLLGGGAAPADDARNAAIVVVGWLTNVPWLVLIPVVAFFLLRDVEVFRNVGLHALPHHLRGRGYRLLQDLNSTLAAYIRAQLLACVIVGVACGIGFAVIGVPYASLLGLIAGIGEFVPLIGPLVVAAITITLATIHAPIVALWAALFLVCLRGVEDYVVYPRLMGHGIHLHPLAVIVAVLIGVELDGVAGVFLAIPTTAIIIVASRHWIEWRRGEPVKNE